jgi:serine/threonine protein kinase
MTERFALLTELGRGGMGVVWKARDEDTGQIVALKVMREMYAEDAHHVARFERELESTKRINPVPVVQVPGWLLADGRVLIAGGLDKDGRPLDSVEPLALERTP